MSMETTATKRARLTGHGRACPRRRVYGAILMLGLFLGLQIASTSHSLHHWLHDDAEEPDHQCALISFAQGQIDQVTPEPIIAPVIVAREMTFAPVQCLRLEVPFELLPSRGPPALA